ncbi:Peroxisome size and maintenance regulator [Yamadazyma tenuis]|uniref:TECPR1-like DysF domain-containing protein n=1 Tax=Candida tenuis (strain ATCC 10573 / BCRC 21748 / CBS 615 / JCM 9827 / NBRC 10315 / NRRL Y-1498 / VKM Y-70) TaxID=590646 RepID=G3B5F9_CANTC|nr:uncharacterized protein CANTEDRAFT_114524 [Yamadazyma tenuis ATCC 10573]EGV63212.1 hypothetical protein CANTEDRAFT_114524 [Yamadazyma tenuis ATCC 10573]WEJ96965.1 Peroxisome size and maintenance regulator [Yamadazyma tenuis]
MDQVSSFLENILTVDNEEDVSKRSSKRYSGLVDMAKKPNSLLVDKLIESLISMIIPVYDEKKIINDRMVMQKTRKPLSMNTMTNNAIMLNARLTNAFILFDNIIKILNWQNPYSTLGVLLIVTHLILNPYLVLALPLTLVVNNILVPHYLIIHPPDISVLEHNQIPDNGPTLNKPHIPGPVPQFSQEFLLNFTDLQNHMVLYIYGYDFAIWLTNDYLYFKNEDVSSLVFLVLLTLIGASLYISPILVPIVLTHFKYLKVGLIAIVWVFGILSYPSNREIILEFLFKEETRIASLHRMNYIENQLVSKFMVPISKDETVSEAVKVVEVFELQKYNKITKSWEVIGFANDFYSINHPLRKLNSNLFKDEESDDGIIEAEDNIKINRVQSVDLVKCAKNWTFLNPNWLIDLNPKVWVEKNLVNEIVNIDDDEKWVYDFYDEDSEIFRRRRWIRYCKRESSADH